jgi:Tfp pilus assembly protein PilF
MPANDSTMRELAGEVHDVGLALLQAGRPREAIVQFRKALAMAPELPDVAVSLGCALHLLGNYQEAVAAYDAALAMAPALAPAWNNRGNALLALCRHGDAGASYSRALELAPELQDARVALATCYQALGRVEEALAACETVLEADPGHAEAHWNRALLLLLKGDYRQGWREYEWRWRKRGFTSPLRDFPQPRWQGEPIPGRTILVHAEQGFGDTLQFCRYVPLVAARGDQVVFECHPPLVPLMESLAGDSVRVIALGEPLPSFDLHIPLLSLAGIFDTTVESVPTEVPYVAPPADCLPFLAGQNIDNGCLRVGLCWAGKAYPDPGRSCPAELLTPLAEIDNVSWYSLQVGWERALPLPMTDFTGHIRDFGDTAALIAQLDLVITVDTSVAHLAGALGKPVWVMLPAYKTDWRWLDARSDSPWYPEVMRLFRQPRRGDWAGVLTPLRAALQAWRAAWRLAPPTAGD